MVCHPDLEELLQAWPAELPDEFFEVTVDDVRRRLAQLKSERWVHLRPSASPCTRLRPRAHPATSARARCRPQRPCPRRERGSGGRASSHPAPVGPPLWCGRCETFTDSFRRKRLEEAPLVTKAFREAQMKEKLERYPKVGRGWGSTSPVRGRPSRPQPHPAGQVTCTSPKACRASVDGPVSSVLR